MLINNLYIVFFRPMEISSKKPVGRYREVVEVKKKVTNYKNKNNYIYNLNRNVKEKILNK